MSETENDRLHRLKDDLPREFTRRPLTPKNDIVKSRGDYPGEAGADWSYGATAKPEADEHRARPHSLAGLRGEDNRQGDLRDQSSNMREPVRGEQAETQRSPHQDAQHGADVRGNAPMVQGTDSIESLPEGLKRDRKGPYDKNVGRADE
jgi:hypothetical protein